MLKAYFDDSGTSDQSDAVLWAGLIGSANQWEQLTVKWGATLATPIDGRVVSHYHGMDAEKGWNEFSEWKRPATNALIYELCKVILDSGMHGFAACTFKGVWREVVQPPLDSILKGPEEFCFSECLQWARGWSMANASGAEVSPIFNTDKQAANIHEAGRIQQNMYGGLSEVSFLDSKPNPEIQAVDMIAGLTFNDLVSWRKEGAERCIGFPLKPFVDSGRFFAVLNDEDVLQKMVQKFKIVDSTNLPGWLP